MAEQTQVAEGVIGLTMDASGLTAESAKVNRTIESMAQAATKAGETASQGVDKIGGSATKSAAEVERAEKKIIGSIERTIAARQAGTKRGTSDYFENLVNLKGLDPAAIQPYIDALRRTEKAADLAAISNNNLGISAKQTAFALRNVPAQLSDIVVSLQGGQRPLTVFLQQGAQLKDLFGGVGNAARSLAGYLVGLVNPYTIAATAVVGLASAYYAGSEQSDRLNKSLIASGNILGATATSLEGLVQKTGKLTGNYSEAREAVELLAKGGVVTGKSLESALGGITAGTNVTGKSIKELTADFESLAKDPVGGIKKLNETQNFLTADIYKQIKALKEQGKEEEAVALASQTYSKALKDRRGEITDNLGYIERGWLAIKNATLSAIDAAAGIGRTLTDAEKLLKLQNELSLLQGRSVGKGAVTRGSEKEVAAKQAEINDLIRQQNTAKFLAGQAAKSQADEKAKIAQSDSFDKYVNSDNRFSKAELLTKKIKDEEKAFAEATKGLDTNTKEYALAVQRRDAAINALKESGNKATAVKVSAEDTTKAKIALINQENALLLKGVDAENAKTTAGLQSQGVSQQTINLLLKATATQNELVTAQKAELKFYEDFDKAAQAAQQARDEQIASINASAQSLEDENLNYGKLPAAITETTIARLNEKKVLLESLGLAVDDINEEIKARERLKTAQLENQRLNDDKKANDERVAQAKKTADKIQQDYEKMSDSINKSITDALFRGFESGKSIAENFKDTLINTFKTLILRPTISAIVSPVSDYLTSILGGGSTPSATASGGSVGGIGSLFTQGKSLFDSLGSTINGSITGGIEKLGVLIANGNGGIRDAIGGFLGKNAGSISNALPYAGAALQLLMGDTKGAAFTAGGALIGSIIPGIGTVLGGAIGGLVGSLFGGAKTKGDQATGTYSNGQFSTGAIFSPEGGGSLGAGGTLDQLNRQFTATLGGFLDAFGINSTISTTANYKAKKDTQAAFRGSVDGAGFGFGFNNYGSGSDAFQKYIDQVLGGTLVQAIQSSKLSTGIKSLFDGLTDKTAINNMLQSTLSLNSAQTQLADSFNLSVDAAARVAKTQADSVAAINALTSAAGAMQTVGDQVLASKTALQTATGFDVLPASLKDFDNLLKQIDTSTAEGVDKFASLFSSRAAFSSLTNTTDTLKTNVTSAIYGVATSDRQSAIANSALSNMFSALNLQVPTSIDELIKLGDSIDYTTKSGLDLANAFPSLVDAFTKAKGGVDGLTSSLNSYGETNFATVLDLQRYRAARNAYGSTAANANLSATGGQNVSNAELLAFMKQLAASMNSTDLNTRLTSQYLLEVISGNQSLQVTAA